MKKKIISFVLVAVMIACMIPFGAITAFAHSVDLGDAYFLPAKGDTTGPKAENLTQNGNYAAYVIEKTGGLDAVIDYIMETGVSTVASDAKIHYDYTEIGEAICDNQYCLPPSAAYEGTELDIDLANAYLIVYYYSDTTKAPTEVLAMASAEDWYLSFDDCYSENTDWLELADPNSGKTEITAEITAADFGYTMVIPTATTLTEANHENVPLGTDGKVSIKDIKHPTDKVNVVYTVDLTNGDLTDGTTTINATYKYKQGDADFAAIGDTTKVTVYENKTVNDSFVNVTANADQWDAAPAGTYNASVTFNFAQEEMVTVKFGTASESWVTYGFVDGDRQPVTSIVVPKGTTFSIGARGNTVTFSNGMTVTVTGGGIDDFFVNGENKSVDYQDYGVNGTINSDTVMEFYLC